MQKLLKSLNTTRVFMQGIDHTIQYSTPINKNENSHAMNSMNQEIQNDDDENIDNSYLVNTFQCSTKYSLNHLNSIFFKHGKIYNLLERTADKKIVKCGCVKSLCEAKYCECFRNGQICGRECGCLGCRNTADQHNKKLAEKSSSIQGNPNMVSFHQLASYDKLDIPNATIPINLIAGCKCKKSGCSKKYCECFQNGKKCGDTCSCLNCLNGKPNTQKNNSQSPKNKAQVVTNGNPFGIQIEQKYEIQDQIKLQQINEEDDDEKSKKNPKMKTKPIRKNAKKQPKSNKRVKIEQASSENNSGSCDNVKQQA